MAEPTFHRDNVPSARRLRQRLTRSEELLWEVLRDRRFEGRKFRRQHPIGAFVVDFYCDELNVAVEIDGGIHDFGGRSERDRLRQTIIEARGTRFVRLRAENVERDLSGSLAQLREALTPAPPGSSP